MTLEQPMVLIVDKIADESRRRRNSAIVWFTLGAIAQAGIVALIYKAQSFAYADTAEKLKFFFVVSPLVAWLPIAAAIYYLRGSRKSAMHSRNALCRALTSEPQLIAEIIREPEIAQPEAAAKQIEKPSDERGANVAGALAEGILEIALSAAFGSTADSDSNDYYDSTADDSTATAPHAPRVFVRLTNGETREIPTVPNAAAIVAALRRHAPHAVVVEAKV